MRTQEIPEPEFLQLACRPTQFVVVQLIQMKSADSGMDRRVANRRSARTPAY